MTPFVQNWQTAFRIYIGVLKNPDASNEAIAAAEAELLKVAGILDRLNEFCDNSKRCPEVESAADLLEEYEVFW